MPASAALDLARQQHAFVFKSSEIAHDRPGPVKRYLSETSALVEAESGARVAVSSAPIATEDESGQLARVDLDLVEDGDGFKPRRGRVKLAMGKRADRMIAFGDQGLMVEPLVGARPRSAQRSGQVLFFASADEANEATDVLVKPIPTGLETFYQLRDDRPRRLALRFSGGPIDVVKLADGFAVRRDGEVLARIPRPWAIDAAGQQVPVRASAAGNSLVMHVDPRGFELPVMVDPAINETYLHWDQGDGVDFGGWQFHTISNFLLGKAGYTDGPYYGWGRGLYVYTTEYFRQTSSATFAPSEWGEWRYDPQGEAFVESLNFVGISNYYNEGGHPLPGQPLACSLIGMFSTTRWAFEPKNVTYDGAPIGTRQGHGNCFYRNHGSEYHNGQPNTSTAGTPGNYAIFNAHTPNGGRPGPFSVYFSGGTLYLSDDDTPDVTNVTHSNPSFSGWSQGLTDTVQVTGHDRGLGMKYVDLWDGGAGQPVPSYTNDGRGISTCQARRHAVCPAYLTGGMTYNTASMPEGIRTVHAKAEDILGRRSDHSWTVRVDRTAPRSPAVNVETAPADGLRARWSAASDDYGVPSSGVGGYRVRSQVEGQAFTPWQTYPADARVSAAMFPETEGVRVTFEVAAVDAAGNVSVSGAASDVFDSEAPSVSTFDESLDANAGYVGGASPQFDVIGEDGGGGVRKLQVVDDSGAVLRESAAACSATCAAEYQAVMALPASQFAEGVVTLGVRAVDRAGNVSPIEELAMIVDRSGPLAPERVRQTGGEPGRIEIGWVERDDVELPGGVPGVGVEHSEFRYRRGAAAFSDWQSAPSARADLSATLGEQIELQVRTRDTLGNASAATSASLVALPGVNPEASEQAAAAARTVAQGPVTTEPADAADLLGDGEPDEQTPDEAAADDRTATASNFTACVPNVESMVARAVTSDVRNFVPYRTRLGARMVLFCNGLPSDTERVLVSGEIGFLVGERQFRSIGRRHTVDLGRPSTYRNVPFTGIRNFCVPVSSGRRSYIVIGTVKYIRSGGTRDVTERFATEIDNAKELTCPDAGLRRFREAKAFQALSRFSPDRGDPVKRTARRQLRRSLGPQPTAPSGVSRAWEAHHIVPVGESQARAARALAFRCRFHPNENQNGIYLRGAGLRKTRNGRTTAAYAELQRTEPGLATRTYHADTFGNKYGYTDELGGRVAGALQQYPEHCSSSDPFRSAIRGLGIALREGSSGVEQPGH